MILLKLVGVPSRGQLELLSRLLRIIIISYVKQDSDVPIIHLTWEHLINIINNVK